MIFNGIRAVFEINQNTEIKNYLLFIALKLPVILNCYQIIENKQIAWFR